MPAYDYRCEACNVVYELREGFDAPSSHACQQCGKGTARRVLRPPAIVFKGSGFYKTDNRSSGGGGLPDLGEVGGGADEKEPATAGASDTGHDHDDGHDH